MLFGYGLFRAFSRSQRILLEEVKILTVLSQINIFSLAATKSMSSVLLLSTCTVVPPAYLINFTINVKKILAVINATYAVAKRKPEKNQACRDSNTDLCDTGQGSSPGKPVFFRLSFCNCISCVNNCEDLLYINFISSFCSSSI